MNIITRASVKERIHVEQIIRSQPHMHNSGLVDIVTIPVRKCLGLSMDVYKPVGEVKEPLPMNPICGHMMTTISVFSFP